MKKTVMLAGIIATLGMFSCVETDPATIQVDDVMGKIDYLIDSVTNQIGDTTALTNDSITIEK